MPPSPAALPASIDDTLSLLASAHYVGDRPLATVLFLSLRMGRPLLLEGEAGVGKTEIAKVLAAALGRKLIRLQCYEGLDVASAVYEWNYAGQMMAIRLAEAGGAADRARLAEDVFSERHLVKRPLLQALEPQEGGPPVLLIDELDRADEDTLARLEGEGRVAFRYCGPEGDPAHGTSPNGSRNHIAGIYSERLNVLGMMPHPENAVEALAGGEDGRGLFDSLMG